MKQLFLLLSIFIATVVAAQRSVNLDKGWEFRRAGTDQWFKAEVPGTIHTDLLAHELIPDPFYRDNESKVQWVENETWEYRTSFDVSKELMQGRHIDIQFDGLDTYAEVYLNGKKIISADNMFRQWAADIKSIVKPKANTLLIVFPPTALLAKLSKKADSIPRPDNERVYVRKAQYQFGWDWGPRLVTCGIWKEVRLVSWNHFLFQSLFFSGEKDAKIALQMSLRSDTSGDFSFRISDGKNLINLPHYMGIDSGANNIVGLIDAGNLFATGPSSKTTGVAYIVDGDTDTIMAFTPFSYAKRDIKLITQTDSIGESFYFTENDKPVFIKGANWIPSDNFLPRAKKLKRYDQLIKAAKEANINMLRVWGGGVYEDDIFYDLCDKYGIMVWQDFMFAGAMYPADSLFAENILQEAIYQVNRLRHHPCIVLWCGNNEIEEAWFNWGWQKQFNYSQADSLKLWNDYLRIFDQQIPLALGDFDWRRPYWPSSPSLGWGRDSAYKKGDVHYWGVWWGKEPVEKYNEKVGRFVSEYGMQGMPDMKTIKEFSLPQDRDTASVVMRTHQKHPFGWENIRYYIEQKFRTSKSFEDLVYVSQLMQADAIKTAIEAHRRNKPATMGSMFWQWNDCWPVTSWSAIDYYGRKKALYYEVKRSFAPVVIIAKETTTGVTVSLISDNPIYDGEYEFNCAVYDLSTGKPIENKGKTTPCSIIEDVTSKEAKTREMYFTREEMKNTVVHFTLVNTDGSDSIIASQFLFFSPPKELKLAKPYIDFRIVDNKLVVTTDRFAYGVFLDVPDGVELSDNYFHLAPREKKIINFTSTMSVEQLRKNIKIRSLVDTY